MAVTSTKDTLARSKPILAGKSGSQNMPLATDANTHIPTLKEVAQSLVALEMTLKELQEAGMRWKLQAYPSGNGKKIALVAFLYHPDYSLGVEDIGNNHLVALIDGAKASEVATRKEPK